MQYECYCKQASFPVGFVWGTLATAQDKKRKTFLVEHSYVIPWARRSGVRKAIQGVLKDHKYDIFTMTGTKDGMKFMKAMKYKKLRPWGLFVDERKKVK